MHHLAQLNIGRLRAPLDDPGSKDFADALAAINAIAESSDGFIWRLKDEDGNSSSYVAVYDDPLVIVNLSLWRDLESLKQFMFKTDHVGFLRRRAEWFMPSTEATSIGWWLAAGEVPDAFDAAERLDRFRADGPGEWGFSLNAPISPPPA